MLIDNPAPFEILLIEDEPADAKLVRMGLREGRVFCNLNHVLDGIEALAFLRREGPNRDATRPDLILLDLNMPRMNGREFLTAVKADEALCSIPVVILTTSDVERDVIASYKLGAAGYITKPVDIEQFIDAMRQIGNYWFSLSCLPPRQTA